MLDPVSENDIIRIKVSEGKAPIVAEDKPQPTSLLKDSFTPKNHRELRINDSPKEKKNRRRLYWDALSTSDLAIQNLRSKQQEAEFLYPDKHLWFPFEYVIAFDSFTACKDQPLKSEMNKGYQPLGRLANVIEAQNDNDINEHSINSEQQIPSLSSPYTSSLGGKILKPNQTRELLEECLVVSPFIIEDNSLVNKKYSSLYGAAVNRLYGRTEQSYKSEIAFGLREALVKSLHEVGIEIMETRVKLKTSGKSLILMFLHIPEDSCEILATLFGAKLAINPECNMDLEEQLVTRWKHGERQRSLIIDSKPLSRKKTGVKYHSLRSMDYLDSLESDGRICQLDKSLFGSCQSAFECCNQKSNENDDYAVSTSLLDEDNDDILHFMDQKGNNYIDRQVYAYGEYDKNKKDCWQLYDCLGNSLRTEGVFDEFGCNTFHQSDINNNSVSLQNKLSTSGWNGQSVTKFRPIDRIRFIERYISDLFSFSALIDHRIIHSAFPLHQPIIYRSLNIWSIPILQQLKIAKPQFSELRSYSGEGQAALHLLCAFISKSLVSFLLVPCILSIGIGFYIKDTTHSYNYWYLVYALYFFVLLFGVWSTVGFDRMLERAIIRWGLDGYKDTTKSYGPFKHDYWVIDPTSIGGVERIATSVKQNRRQILSYICFFLLVMFNTSFITALYMIGIRQQIQVIIEESADNYSWIQRILRYFNLLKESPTVEYVKSYNVYLNTIDTFLIEASGGYFDLKGLSILITSVYTSMMDPILTNLASFLVKRENHKYLSDFYHSLVVKSFALRVANTLYGLIFLSFIKPHVDPCDTPENGNCLPTLKLQVTTTMCTTIFALSFKLIVSPWFKRFARRKTLNIHKQQPTIDEPVMIKKVRQKMIHSGEIGLLQGTSKAMLFEEQLNKTSSSNTTSSTLTDISDLDTLDPSVASFERRVLDEVFALKHLLSMNDEDSVTSIEHSVADFVTILVIFTYVMSFTVIQPLLPVLCLFYINLYAFFVNCRSRWAKRSIPLLVTYETPWPSLILSCTHIAMTIVPALILFELPIASDIPIWIKFFAYFVSQKGFMLILYQARQASNDDITRMGRIGRVAFSQALGKLDWITDTTIGKSLQQKLPTNLWAKKIQKSSTLQMPQQVNNKNL